MLTKFAIELLNEVAEECEQRSCSLQETEQKRELFGVTADKITEFMELVVESDETQSSN